MNELKVLPHNLDAEQSILGGILVNNEAISNVWLKPDDFYREAHSHIFDGMLNLHDKGEPIDFITLSQYLSSKDLLEKTGGTEYLVSLAEGVSTSAGIKSHAKTVKNLSIKRKIIQDNQEINEMCFSGFADLEEIMDSREKSVTEMAQDTVKGKGFQLMSEVIGSGFKDIEKAAETDGFITGVPTGFMEFDQLTAGLQPSDLIILAGRPSMGKTALALNIAQSVASDGGTVAVFSIEMASEQLGIRMIGTDSRVNAKALRAGFLKDNDWIKITESANKISNLPIFIDDAPKNVLYMKTRCRKLQRKHGLSLVIVDYLQLMEGRRGSESRQLEISEISRSLKLMAKELKVPVMALSQLNRKVEDRPNKRPRLADIRESGAIEQDADVIAFIYRDEVYNQPTEENRNIAEIILAKQRNGPTGYFKLTFLKEITRFEDYAREPDYDYQDHY